jgi:hypothetical protein
MFMWYDAAIIGFSFLDTIDMEKAVVPSHLNGMPHEDIKCFRELFMAGFYVGMYRKQDETLVKACKT